jgi:hypothetical protein
MYAADAYEGSGRACASCAPARGATLPQTYLLDSLEPDLEGVYVPPAGQVSPVLLIGGAVAIAGVLYLASRKSRGY